MNKLVNSGLMSSWAWEGGSPGISWKIARKPPFGWKGIAPVGAPGGSFALGPIIVTNWLLPGKVEMGWTGCIGETLLVVVVSTATVGWVVSVLGGAVLATWSDCGGTVDGDVLSGGVSSSEGTGASTVALTGIDSVT